MVIACGAFVFVDVLRCCCLIGCIVQISDPMVDVRTGVRNRSIIRTGDVD
jgi:hypothetical protein